MSILPYEVDPYHYPQDICFSLKRMLIYYVLLRMVPYLLRFARQILIIPRDGSLLGSARQMHVPRSVDHAAFP